MHDINRHDFQQSDGVLAVKGRLKLHLAFWHEIRAYENVIDIIDNGYKIPFLECPPPNMLKNNASAFKHSVFVQEAITDLLNSGRIVELTTIPTVVNPLSVTENSSGKLRLILDLRYVNQFVWKHSFKFEDWRTLFQYVKRNNFLFAFDIKSAFHCIDVFVEHQQYLGFGFNMSGQVRYFYFTVLPFGLCNSPYVFSKVLRCLVKHWRNKGLQIVLFLDDGACTNDSYDQCALDSDMVRSDLHKAGFVINEEKSIWRPVQVIEWLGLVWNCIDGSLYIPEKRLVKITLLTNDILTSLFGVSARKLAKLCGLIISLSPSVGHITRLMTRQMYRVIDERSCWDKPINIANSTATVQEIVFWQKSIGILNGSRSFDTNTSVCPLKIKSDASNQAAGAFVEMPEPAVCHRMFSEAECLQSSTHRELLAIHFALSSFAPLIQNKDVLVHSDSSNAVSIVEKGSTKMDLQAIAMNIFSVCLTSGIRLQLQWIPRSENEIADYLSRLTDSDDWGISFEFFHFLNTLGPALTIDRFATSQNAKLPRFNSRFWNPGTLAIDAFTQNWSDDYNLLVPPVHLILRCLSHWISTKASGILVAPAWRSSVFWPVFFPQNKVSPTSIRKFHILDNHGNIFIPGSSKTNIFGQNKVNSVLIVEFDAT
ncbi:MAG: reverse transcriptase domain-containing protein [Sedimenticola sp.]